MDQRDKKLTLVKKTFSMTSYEKLTKNEINMFLETAQDLLHLIYSFGKNVNVTNFVNVWMLEDPIEDQRL